MNRIDKTFQAARAEGRTVFIPFVTAGDPDLDATGALIRSFADVSQRTGVPFVFEIGFPYTDPIADGATIQASYTRALSHHTRIEQILAEVRSLRSSLDAPLVAMVTYSLVFCNGPDRFLASAKEAGFDGAIIPDLPVEEASEVHAAARDLDFKIIQLVAPTTPDERAIRIAGASTGFLYYMSVAGITGERDALPDQLPARVAWLREHTNVPVCVGFGISRPEHVAGLHNVADGVIVGSAIVRRLEHLAPGDADGVQSIAHFVESLIEPLTQSRSEGSP